MDLLFDSDSVVLGLHLCDDLRLHLCVPKSDLLEHVVIEVDALPRDRHVALGYQCSSEANGIPELEKAVGEDA